MPRLNAPEFAHLPDGALPCLWMSAGLLAYRLCQREYDCDGCPFDVAIRGGRPRAAGPDGGPLPHPRFPRDRRYHASHTWAKRVAGKTIRCGMDGFASRLLSPVHSVVLPATGSRLSQGRTACWVVDSVGLIPLRSPVSGKVVRVNAVSRTEPRVVSDAPYHDGWLMELHVADRPDDDALLSADEIRECAHVEARELEDRTTRFLTRQRKNVGTTPANGDASPVDARRILGADRYRRLVLRFLR